MQKNGQKHKIFKTMLKLTSFSMSKLMVLYFRPFWTPLLTIGYEIYHFGYVVDFEFFKNFYYMHNKEL